MFEIWVYRPNNLKKFMYYIKNRKTGELITVQSLSEVITCLENYIWVTFNKTRKEFMDDMVSLGYGYDDSNGIYLSQIMNKYLEMGAVYKTGTGLVYKEGSVYEFEFAKKHKDETGD